MDWRDYSRCNVDTSFNDPCIAFFIITKKYIKKCLLSILIRDGLIGKALISCGEGQEFESQLSQSNDL